MRRLAVVLLLTGCASAATTPPGPLSGVWAGTFAIGPSTGQIEFWVVQRGGELSGTAVASDGSGTVRGSVVGRVEGDAVTGRVATAGARSGNYEFSGTLRGDTLTGTLRGGTMEVRKVK